MEHTFNSYGASWVFRPLISLFEIEEKSFGSAVIEVQLVVSFRSKSSFKNQNVNRSLGRLYADFHSHLAKLPKRSFFRKKRTLSIELCAGFAVAEEIKPNTREEYKIRNEKYFYEYNLNLLDQLIEQIKACRSKFKERDDFDFEAFLNWIESLRHKMPDNKADADLIIESWEIKKKEAFEQMSDWEKLGLDWKEYHPTARNIISDPRLWNVAHDFAPNGNDTGADILEMLREVKNRKSLTSDGGKTFYKATWRDWGFSDPSPLWPDDSTDYHVHRELIVGLAFAFVKLKGGCPDWLKQDATANTETYVKYLETHELKWPHRKECLAYQDLILKTLDRF